MMEKIICLVDTILYNVQCTMYSMYSVHASIGNEQPLANYTHCTAHRVNLVLKVAIQDTLKY